MDSLQAAEIYQVALAPQGGVAPQFLEGDGRRRRGLLETMASEYPVVRETIASRTCSSSSFRGDALHPFQDDFHHAISRLNSARKESSLNVSGCPQATAAPAMLQ